MNLRWSLFLALVGGHAATAFVAPDTLAPAFAGSIYLPLMVLHAAGLPVLAPAASGGWPAPSAPGWVMVVLLWLAVWWGVASLASRVLSRRRCHA
jgi:hypothetical protein